jgi:hypothetical protein
MRVVRLSFLKSSTAFLTEPEAPVRILMFAFSNAGYAFGPTLPVITASTPCEATV